MSPTPMPPPWRGHPRPRQQPFIGGANCHEILEKLVATTRWFGSNLHLTLDRLFSVFRTVDELAGVFPEVGDPGFSISR